MCKHEKNFAGNKKEGRGSNPENHFRDKTIWSERKSGEVKGNPIVLEKGKKRL